MDLDRLDHLARFLASGSTRRRLLGLLPIPVVGGLLTLTELDETEAKDRRRRRKGRHKRRKRKEQGKRRRCKPKRRDVVCASQCGSVKNRKTCGKRIDCGPCPCDPPCAGCQTCDVATQTCVTTCSATDVCCDATCADLQTNANHCGACGNACAEGQVCQGGVCGVLCGGDFCPAASEICVDDACVPCDVTCTGSAAACGQALTGALAGAKPTLYVCPGTYAGGFILNRDVALIGAGQGTDPAADTILDGEDTHMVIDIPNDKTIGLRQLHITRGRTDDSNGGAAIDHIGELLTMTDCTVSHSHTITQDDALGRGAITNGGLSHLVMTRCTVRDNSVTNTKVDSTSAGGGLFNSGELEMTDCLIRNNTAQASGGGLFNAFGSTTLTNCRITENTLTNPATDAAGGIWVDNGTATLVDSYVWNNTPPDCGVNAGHGTITGDGCGDAPD